MEELAKDIDYEKEYKKVMKENQELKETIISMTKVMFLRDNALVEIIKNIEKELKIMSKRK